MSKVSCESGLRAIRNQRTASRPDFVDQVAQRHVAAGALGDLHLLAAAHDGDHLVQHVFRIALRDAGVERLQAGAHALRACRGGPRPVR
jgi:hypothetical protein